MALNSWAKFFASQKAGTRGTVQPATQQVPINHGFGGNSGKGGVQAVPQPKKAAAPAPAPAPKPAAPVQQNTYNPTPLVPDARQQQPSLNIMMPEMPPPQYSAGGAGAEVGTNAAGFRRKKSSARMAGLTSKGTSQFKISGQSARSSGLNIGT